MRTATTLLLALVLVAAPAATVQAQQGEEPNYETDVSDEHATIEITREVEDREASTEITFDTKKGLFETSFDYENATSETESELEVALHQIVEYTDDDEDGRYSANDTVESAWRLSRGSENVTADSNGTVSWKALNETRVVSDEGVEGTRIKGIAQIPGQGPLAGVLEQIGQGENRTFRVDIYVFGEPTTLNGQPVGAMEVKIDLSVHNYPYTKNGTALALVTETSSEQEIEFDEENASTARARQEIEDATVDLAFSWSDQATVDGETTPVHTTVLDEETESEMEDDEASSETERMLAFSYERGTDIVHDPTLGASLASSGDLVTRAGDSIDEVPGYTVWASLAGVLGAVAIAGARKR